MANHKAILLHLHEEYTEPIRDPIWKNIGLSEPLKRILSHERVQKLARIKQLGPTYLVYPGATHTRLNHSLGVFHLAKRIVEALLSFSACRDLSLEGVKAFLCASLLHDLGHFPYAHSLKELALTEHETLTGDIVLSRDLSGIIKERLRVDPKTVAAIVDLNRPCPEDGELPFFRNLLSGVLDPDKLDYLTRDAFFCGIPYGVQDIDFIINRIKPHPARGIALDPQGLPAIENILFSKYLMYKSVYWHKTVRVATAMIKKAIMLGLREGAIFPETLYGLTDEDFFLILERKNSFLPFSLVPRVLNRNLLKIAFEAPFPPDDPGLNMLLDLSIRTEAEEKLCGIISKKTGKEIQPHDIIIDIPEPISFEIDVPIIGKEKTSGFPEAGSVFTEPVVKGFQSSLRQLRIMVPPGVVSSTEITEEDLRECL